MVNGHEPNKSSPNPNWRVTSAGQGILPESAAIIAAFRDPPDRDGPHRLVLEIANELAAHHQRQWHAEDASRAPGASVEDIAASKRLIDALNHCRVSLVEQIDAWVGREVQSPKDASLHTESLGSVVDRLAIAWVRSNSLASATHGRDRARLAMRQFTELASAYDILIREVGDRRRRLPTWLPLKQYGGTS